MLQVVCIRMTAYLVYMLVVHVVGVTMQMVGTVIVAVSSVMLMGMTVSIDLTMPVLVVMPMVMVLGMNVMMTFT